MMKEHGVKSRTECVVVVAVIVHQDEIALEVCAPQRELGQKK